MFIDTSGLLAYFHKDEPEHSIAKRLFSASSKKLTHSYVLSEFVTLVRARRLPLVPAIKFVANLLIHPQVEVVWVDEILHLEAMQLLEQRLDKAYSHCDAVSFALMRQQGLVEALTTDHHYEQEHFTKLLF